jgi:hypothetical protein
MKGTEKINFWSVKAELSDNPNKTETNEWKSTVETGDNPNNILKVGEKDGKTFIDLTIQTEHSWLSENGGKFVNIKGSYPGEAYFKDLIDKWNFTDGEGNLTDEASNALTDLITMQIKLTNLSQAKLDKWDTDNKANEIVANAIQKVTNEYVSLIDSLPNSIQGKVQNLQTKLANAIL